MSRSITLSSWPHSALVFLVSVICFSLVGCSQSGPERGQVTGTVTLDGQPLANADVCFQPTQGRASTGVTDAEGKYELNLTGQLTGAVPGQHKVTFTTYREQEYGQEAEYDEENEGSGLDQEAVAESIPRHYLTEEDTILSVEVVAGNNVHDFALTSENPN